ncbi:hypothetical protein FOCC_FOCC002988, partial [Frankliniella occidentalis]
MRIQLREILNNPILDPPLLTPPETPEEAFASPPWSRTPARPVELVYHLTWLDQDGSMSTPEEGADPPHPFQGIIDYLLAGSQEEGHRVDQDAPISRTIEQVEGTLEEAVWPPGPEELFGDNSSHLLTNQDFSPSGRTSVQSLETTFTSPGQDFASPLHAFASPVQEFVSFNSPCNDVSGRTSVQSLETVFPSHSPSAVHSAFASPSPTAAHSAFASPSPSAVQSAFASPSPSAGHSAFASPSPSATYSAFASPSSNATYSTFASPSPSATHSALASPSPSAEGDQGPNEAASGSALPGRSRTLVHSVSDPGSRRGRGASSARSRSALGKPSAKATCDQVCDKKRKTKDKRKGSQSTVQKDESRSEGASARAGDGAASDTQDCDDPEDGDKEEEKEDEALPSDPQTWTAAHVSQWLRWCSREFHITPLPDPDKFPRSGGALLELDGAGFESRAGSSRGARLLRSHLAHT